MTRFTSYVYFFAAARICTAIVFCTLLVLSLPTHAKWPSKEYKLIQENPTTWLPSIGSEHELSDEQAAQIERWMRQVAFHFEGQGWRAPKHALQGDGTIPVYVYVFNDPEKPLADVPGMKVLMDCDTFVTTILIDPRKWSDSTADYQALAHELFHTVQYAYPVFQTCESPIYGEWIREGTAEAVGVETARTLNPKRFSKSPGFCAIGLRDYGSPLYVKDRKAKQPCGQLAYSTSSFWQYLGEYHQLGAKPALDNKLQADFSYLQALFSTKPDNFNAVEEYQWLNKAVKTEFGFNLRRAYRSFTGAFSGYFEHRSKYYASPRKPVTNAIWHEVAFGGKCEQIELNAAKQSHSFAIKDFASMSARCALVSLPPGQQELTIDAFNGGEVLNALNISVDYGMQTETPITRTVDETVHAVFNFSLAAPDEGPNRARYFVITHAPTKRTHYRSISPTVRFRLTGGSSNTSPGSKPSTSKRKGAKGLTAEAFDDELAINKQSSSWRGRVFQRATETHISLELVPNELTALAASRSIQTMAGRAGAIDSSAIAATSEKLQATASKEGSLIRLKIPRIDYGFAGDIDDASISMIKALEDRDNSDFYDSRGKWEGGCNGGSHVHTGQVTIEEASPLLLKGSYRSTVVDPDLRDNYFCRNLPIHKEIAGAFSIANPNLDSAQHVGDNGEAAADFINNEVSEMLPGSITPELKAEIEAIAARKDKERLARKESRKAKAASTVASCDCNCLMAPANAQKANCFKTCEPEYRKCKNPSFDQIKLFFNMSRSPTTAEEDAIDEMRNELIELLEREPKQYVRDTWLNQFDNAQWWMKDKTLELVKERYGE